jgi:outer membrane biosynthesis protein TonB
VDAVTEILIDRSHQADRLSQLVVVSLLAHALLLGAVAVSGRLWPDSGPARDEHVMTISLAGGEGPIQGHNPASAKPVQQAAPDTAKPKEQAPPMLTRPEMVEPVPAKRPEPKSVTTPEPRKETPQLHSRTPTQGPEVRQGTARTETGQTTPIPFGGLATGGNGVGGVRTDTSDFCCPDYLTTMQRLVYANWRPNQGTPGKNSFRFVVQRDGTITDIKADQSAGAFLDLASQRALEQTRRLPPLPAPYRGDRLTVILDFTYR